MVLFMSFQLVFIGFRVIMGYKVTNNSACGKTMWQVILVFPFVFVILRQKYKHHETSNSDRRVVGHRARGGEAVDGEGLDGGRGRPTSGALAGLAGGGS
jgi:hypothetical protein